MENVSKLFRITEQPLYNNATDSLIPDRWFSCSLHSLQNNIVADIGEKLISAATMCPKR